MLRLRAAGWRTGTRDRDAAGHSNDIFLHKLYVDITYGEICITLV
jgi:hypothetical protein